MIKSNSFALFASERNMEPPNLDFFDLGLENLFLMFMVYIKGLVGKFIRYVNSSAVKNYR